MGKFTFTGIFGASLIGILLYFLYVEKFTSRFEDNVVVMSAKVKIPQHVSSQFEDILRGDQHDPQLITFLRDEVIKPPSGLEYNLKNPEKEDFSNTGQGKFLYEFFKHKRNGTFIEVGAYDGEEYSNTLILERKLGWSGLLIEPNPISYKNLLGKNRKAYHAECGLSLTPRRSQFNISLDKMKSLVLPQNKNQRAKVLKNKNAEKYVSVNSYPLYSLMVAANLATLDVLILDMETVDVKVLKTIPFNDVDIKVIMLEVDKIPEGQQFLKEFMTQQNYKLEKTFPADFLFLKN